MREGRSTGSGPAPGKDPDLVWIAPFDESPFVRLAAEALAARLPRSHGAIDGTGMVVAVPGARAGRLLLEQLLAVAEAEGVRLDPPTVTTADRLAETIFFRGNAPAAASRFERIVAWRRVLSDATGEERAILAGGGTLDRRGIAALAATALGLEDELALEGQTFEDAAAAVGGVAGAILAGRGDPDDLPDESLRWQALAGLARRVGTILAAAGLATTAERNARLVADGEPQATGLFLVGLLEVPSSVRRVAARVPATIILPEPAVPDAIGRRDAFGVPRPDAIALPEVPEAQIEVCGSPRGQAEAAIAFLRRVAALEPTPAIDEVAIGLADATLAGAVVAAGRDAGIGIHDAAGVPFARREPIRALSAALDFARDASAGSFAVLARCPAAAVALAGDEAANVASTLDRFLAETCLERLDGPLPEGAPGVAAIARWRTRLAEAIAPLHADPVAPSEAAAAIVAVLARLGIEGNDDDRRPLERIVREIADARVEATGPISPREAAEFLLERAAAERVPADPRREEIELLGWLELLFEPARHLCILGMNEGCVPASRRADPWLTGSLRTALGLPGPEARLARDAAFLGALRRWHPDLRLVFGRASAAGDPLLPSRLLLAPRGEALARRVRALFPEGASAPARAGSRRGPSGFAVPRPPPGFGASLESLSVTDFRAYLADPIRFWLERCEGLSLVDPAASELEPRRFGTLLHRAVDLAFGDEAVRTSTDPERIRTAFLDALDAEVAARHGRRPRPAIRMQLRSARARLEALARVEARERAAGWTIEATERTFSAASRLEPAGGGASIAVRGTCDRLERRDDADGPRYRVLDLKTGDSAKEPKKAHWAGRSGSERWVDLQLPLYRHFLAEELGVDPSRISTGYVQLPAVPAEVQVAIADFDEADYASALAQAREVVRQLRNDEFPASRGSGRDDDPLRFILHVPVFSGGGGDADRPDAEGET